MKKVIIIGMKSKHSKQLQYIMQFLFLNNLDFTTNTIDDNFSIKYHYTSNYNFIENFRHLGLDITVIDGSSMKRYTTKQMEKELKDEHTIDSLIKDEYIEYINGWNGALLWLDKLKVLKPLTEEMKRVILEKWEESDTNDYYYREEGDSQGR